MSTRSRALTVAAAVALLFVAACGPPSAEPAKSSGEDLERATLAGLAAAVLTHLDPDSVESSSGGGNDYEKWMAVDIEVQTAAGVVPLSVFVMEYSEETGRPPAGDACSDDRAVLSCRVEETDDGSTVVLRASTEDLTGGIFTTGFLASVLSLRDDYLVLVMQDVPSRKPHYVDMTQLPLDVTVLKEIATDPMVGTHTSPELNDAGKDLTNFFADE